MPSTHQLDALGRAQHISVTGHHTGERGTLDGTRRPEALVEGVVVSLRVSDGDAARLLEQVPSK